MKVGDYVRTKSYGIAKILNIYNNTTTNYISLTLDKIDSFGRLGVSVNNDNIIKSSPNITDLIEVGDYVNGSKVQEIGEDYVEIEEYSGLNNDLPLVVKTEDIKSIVTKEQFKSMEYKVGE